jgi:23S rRNA U2552 (ribose-2'-O)-methylase RlmE/FtsJ
MRIGSEEPIDHWGFLDVKDKVILDLGCSPFHSSISTPQYFIKKGASKVIGIDLGYMQWTNDKLIMIPMTIQNTKQIQDLLAIHKPDIIKADIEGAEFVFGGIYELYNVKEIAIEYHDNELKVLMERKFDEWGFINPDLYQLFDIETERMGVLHARK